MAATESPNREVLEAVRLLVGDIIDRKPYIMLGETPEKGQQILGRFRTISDASRYVKRNHLGPFTLWTQVQLKRKKAARPPLHRRDETVSGPAGDEEDEVDLDDLLGDTELPDLDEDADLDDLL